MTPKKAGAAITDGPAPCPSSAGSHCTGQVSPRAKLRALFDVLGPSILRTPDGSTLMLTPDALKTITPVHGA